MVLRLAGQGLNTGYTGAFHIVFYQVQHREILRPTVYTKAMRRLQPLPPLFSLGLVTAQAQLVPGTDLDSVAAYFQSAMSEAWAVCVQGPCLFLVAPNNVESASVIVVDASLGLVQGVFSGSCPHACGRPQSCPCSPCAPSLECPVQYGAAFINGLQAFAQGPVACQPPLAELQLVCEPSEGDACELLPTVVFSVPLAPSTPSNAALGFPEAGAEGALRCDGALLVRDHVHRTLTLVLPNTNPWLPCAPLVPQATAAAAAYRAITL
jgi:hypothetical protein